MATRNLHHLYEISWPVWANPRSVICRRLGSPVGPQNVALHSYQGRAPNEPRAEGHQQHQTSRTDHARLPGFVEGDRQRRRGDVAVILHVDEHLLAAECPRVRRSPPASAGSPGGAPARRRRRASGRWPGGIPPWRPTSFRRRAGTWPCRPCESGPGRVDVLLGDVLRLRPWARARRGRVEGLGVAAVGVQMGGEDPRAGHRPRARPPRPPPRRRAGSTILRPS